MKKIIVMICMMLLIFPVTSGSVVKICSAIVTDDLPASFSWRDINGTDYTTPIRDQSPAPTCEAFGLCAALETEMQYKLKEQYLPDLSENHLYFNAGGTIEKGWVNLNDAANYLMQYGVPDEGCFPDPHRAFDYPYYSLPGWENRTVKISEWGWIDHNNITTMKHALIDHGPLIICIHFWADFFLTPGRIYKHHNGRIVGGHVVTIVGYDDNENCWIVKNSWGTKWGQKGWFKMAYDADMISEWYENSTGVMYIDGVYGNLKPDVPKVHIETPVYYHTYIVGLGFPTIFKKLPLQKAAARIVGKLTVSVQTENTERVEFYLDNTSQYVDTNAPFTWDLQATPGFHTLEAKAMSANGNQSIDVEDIYVIL
jgi:hypothetical protein